MLDPGGSTPIPQPRRKDPAGGSTRQAEAPGRHGAGQGGARTRRDPRLPGGRPFTLRHPRPRAGPECHSPAQEVGSGSLHWQVALSGWAMTLGGWWAPSSSQESAEVTSACGDLFSKLS